MEKVRKTPAVGDRERNPSKYPSPAKHPNLIDEGLKPVFNVLINGIQGTTSQNIKKSIDKQLD